MQCVKCGKQNPEHKCSRCFLVYYCSKDCQRQDWISNHYDEENDDDDDELPDCVLPLLCIGGLRALKDRGNEFDAIVTAVSYRRVSEAAMKAILKHFPNVKETLRIPIEDRPNAPLEQYLDESQRFIDKHIQMGHRVLVHCSAGISRSVSVVVNYFMYAGLADSVNEALKKITKKRKQANPNQGFLDVLHRRWD